MNDILATAEDLGKAIAASERFRALAAARKAADEDQPLRADMRSLNELARKLEKLSHETKPIEPEDKRRLRELQEKVTENPAMRQLARAEADFAELMNRVGRAMHAQMKPQETPS